MQLPSPLGQLPIATPSVQAPAQLPVSLVYAPLVVVDLSLGSSFIITAIDGVAFTIGKPREGFQQPSPGQRLNFTIKNASGGALGAVSWNAAYKQAGSFAAGNGQRRSAQFEFDGTNWVLIAGPTADVPN